jgi:hypothetical protein
LRNSNSEMHGQQVKSRVEAQVSHCAADTARIKRTLAKQL